MNIKLLRNAFFIGLILISSVNILRASPEERVEHVNSVYKFLDHYDFLISPVSCAVCGAKIFGLPGFALGFRLGLLDEVLQKNSYLSGRFITRAFIGASIFNTLSLPFYIGESFGVLAGIMSSLDCFEDYAQNFSIYINSFVLFASMSHFLIPKVHSENLRIFLTSFYGCLGTFLYTFLNEKYFDDENEFFLEEPNAPIDQAEDLKRRLDSNFERLLSSGYTEDFQNKQMFIKTTLSIIKSLMNIKLGYFFNSFKVSQSELSFENFESQRKMNNLVLNFVASIFIDFFFKTLSLMIKGYHQENISIHMTNKVNRMFTDRSFLYQAANLSLNSDIQNFRENLNLLSSQGVDVLWDASEKHTEYFDNVLRLMKYGAIDAALCIYFYDFFINSILNLLKSSEMQNHLEVESLKSKSLDLERDLRTHAKSVVSGAQETLILSQMEDYQRQIKKILAENYPYNLLYTILNESQFLLNFVLSYALISYKVTFDGLDTENAEFVRLSVSQLSFSGNWHLKNKEELSKIKNSLDSVVRVLNHLESSCDALSTVAYERSNGFENKIVLSNFEMGLLEKEKELLSLPYLELHAKYYALTGPPASGKTSLLSKIMGVSCDGIYSHGKVSVSFKKQGEHEIYQIPQKVYIAPHSSLIEIISGKNIKNIEEDLKLYSEIVKYLKILQIDDEGDKGIVSQLYLKDRNWRLILSGGQKKKIALVAMLLRKPNLVFLDEVFAGLDDSSIRIIQKLIREELSDSIVLIVDHKAERNNFDNFYDAHLHLEDGSLSLESW